MDTFQPETILLMTTYAAGLRVGEVVRLRLTDIESERMLIRVNQGKGRKDRYTLLSTRPSNMTCIQCSLSRHGAPGPMGSGRRMVKSTGTTNLPSPTTTTSNTPSMPESTRCSCPLHQVSTNPNCSPYFLNTESSPTQVHCQRLRVAALLRAA